MPVVSHDLHSDVIPLYDKTLVQSVIKVQECITVPRALTHSHTFMRIIKRKCWGKREHAVKENHM